MTKEKIDIKENKDLIVKYHKTKNILKDSCIIIESAKEYAYKSINIALIQRNWLLGKRIYEEELYNEKRAEYGLEVIKSLSKELTKIYGKGFTKTNLYNYLSFYKYFSQIFHSVSGKSNRLLTWTHYRVLIQVHDEDARNWYEKEALDEMWSVRTLQRNVSSQYYYRILNSQKKDLNKSKLKENKINKLEFIKNPVIAEFLEMKTDEKYYETNLESCIISNLQEFLIELGKGYAFVARQQHIKTEKEDYFIDLVFYNYILKCFVLIDLKTSKIKHQDIGQMDMYIRMYDEIKKGYDDNPTIGILLCSDTDEDIARYSILNDRNNLFATKYMAYMPTKEELKQEIDRQKAIYYLENNN